MNVRHTVFAFGFLASACGGASSPPAATPPDPSTSATATGTSAPAGASAADAWSDNGASDAGAAPAATPLTPDAIKAIVAAPDRTADDKKMDTGRHPAEFLAFTGIGAGMSVADIAAAGGYTSELLARAVGPTGKVYGQNDPEMLKKFAEKPWSARLALPADQNVTREDRPFDDPLPPGVKNLDIVTLVLFYHDTVWLGTDRAKMNKAIFDALKPGGSYVIEDATAKDGRGVQDVKTLHRIEQSVVEAEVKKAGFTEAASGDFLRNPKDTRDWSSSPREAGKKLGTEDRFILRFTKPAT